MLPTSSHDRVFFRAEFNFYQEHQLEVKFSGEQLSTDGGILIARQAEEKVKIIKGMSELIADRRDPNRITHTMEQLVLQRVLQLANGYEDAVDCNQMRRAPILKIACKRMPLNGEEMLASQPTMTRLENQVTKRENGAMRSLFVERFIEQHKTVPKEIVLDIDGWDAPTHGNQQLSFFHGYYPELFISKIKSIQFHEKYRNNLEKWRVRLKKKREYN